MLTPPDKARGYSANFKLLTGKALMRFQVLLEIK